MVRLFGEHLVDLNFITEAQLVEALVTQMREVPSVVEIIYDHQLLSHDQILSILKKQQIEGTDFRTTANDLGVWTEELAESIHAELRKIRRPIGEILVSLGCLSLDQLTSSLDSYNGNNNRSDLLIKAPEPKVASQGVSEMRPLDPFLASEYADTFAKTHNPVLNTMIENLQSALNDSESFNAIKNGAIAQVVSITAAAQFLGAEKSLNIAIALRDAFKEIGERPDSEHAKGLIDLLKIARNLLESLALYIDQFKNEGMILRDSNLIDLDQRFWRQIQKLSGATHKRAA